MNEAVVGKNTIYSLVKSVSTILFPLIMFSYGTRILLVDNIGKVSFGESIISYMALIASLGIPTYAIRECAKVKNNRNELSKVTSQLVSINLITTIVAYGILALLLLFAKSLETYRLLICVQSTSIMFMTLGSDWINTAMEDLRYITIRTIVFQVIAILLMLLFVHKPEDYYIYVIISVISSAGGNVVNIFYRRKYCRIKLTLDIDWERHISPVLLMFSMLLSQTIYCNSDLTMLGIFRGDYDVGIYSVAVKIYNMVNTLVASITYVVMPQLSYWFAKKDYKEINSLLKYAIGFVVTLGVPCVVGINIVAEGIVEIVAGRGYLEAAIPVRILTIALVCSFIGGICGNLIFLPSGREKICFKSCVVSAVINIILNLFLIPHWGYVAASITTVISEFVGMCIGLSHVEKEITFSNAWKLLRAPVIGGFFIIIEAWIVNKIIGNGLIETLVIIIIGLILYVVILVLMKHEFLIEFRGRLLKRNTRF